MNRKGMTLLEMLIVLVLIGIIVQLLCSLMVGLNRSIARAAKAQSSLTAAQASSYQHLKLDWTDKELQAGHTPVLCFTANAVYSCLPRGCEYKNELWYQDGHKCTAGIIYY